MKRREQARAARSDRLTAEHRELSVARTNAGLGVGPVDMPVDMPVDGSAGTAGTDGVVVEEVAWRAHRELARALIREAEGLRGIRKFTWLFGLIPLLFSAIWAVLRERSANTTIDQHSYRRALQVGLVLAVFGVAWGFSMAGPRTLRLPRERFVILALVILVAGWLVVRRCGRAIDVWIVGGCAVLALNDLVARLTPHPWGLVPSIWISLLMLSPAMCVCVSFRSRTSRLRVGVCTGLAMFVSHVSSSAFWLLKFQLDEYGRVISARMLLLMTWSGGAIFLVSTAIGLVLPP